MTGGLSLLIVCAGLSFVLGFVVGMSFDAMVTAQPQGTATPPGRPFSSSADRGRRAARTRPADAGTRAKALAGEKVVRLRDVRRAGERFRLWQGS